MMGKDIIGRNRELFRLRASWLAGIFPDEVVVQEKTVSVIKRGLFVSHVETMPVRDIGRVVLASGPFFAGLRIIGKSPAHELVVGGLHKAGAMKAKDIIEGLLLEGKASAEVPYWEGEGKRREYRERAVHLNTARVAGR